MSAYLVGHITVHNPKLWQEYVAGVQKSLLPFGSEIIFRGEKEKVLTGEHQHNSVVVIEFTDRDTLDTWYQSEAYQAIIPIRDKAADVTIISYNTV